MKKKHMKWLTAAAAVCIVGLALMGAAGSRESGTVEELLKKRSDVMENVLFGKITYEEGAQQLKAIEKDKLLGDDLEALTQYRNTDLESMEDMEIIKLEKKSHVYDKMTFAAEIKWTISGPEGVYDEVMEYQVGIDTNEGDYRLISFEFQQK